MFPILVSYTLSKEVSYPVVRWLCMSGLDTGEDGALFFPPPLLFDKDLPLWNIFSTTYTQIHWLQNMVDKSPNIKSIFIAFSSQK
jgi:hypothetical protein